LSRDGKAIAFYIEPDGGTFGPGSQLYFVSEGHRLNPYGHEAVYELEIGELGEVISVDSAGPVFGRRAGAAEGKLLESDQRLAGRGV
jgi:hypothetical protein